MRQKGSVIFIIQSECPCHHLSKWGSLLEISVFLNIPKQQEMKKILLLQTLKYDVNN